MSATTNKYNLGLKSWFHSGLPWIWLNAAAVSASLILVIGLLLLIAVRGLGHFWPKDVYEISHQQPDNRVYRVIGERIRTEPVGIQRLLDAGMQIDAGDRSQIERSLIKTGNRDITGLDFRWILDINILSENTPADITVLERKEWGAFYGYIKEIREANTIINSGATQYGLLNEKLAEVHQLLSQAKSIEKDKIGKLNYELERLRLKQRKLELKNKAGTASNTDIQQRQQALESQYQIYFQQLQELNNAAARTTVIMEAMGGERVEISLANIVRAYQPNDMSVFGKLIFYLAKLWEFVSEDPREANTEGGIFPAIFGTIIMVLLMSVVVTPFGVVAAVYLYEYANQGVLTRLIRVAVNNLAGVPSIVYGVFGLGFFVYTLGGGIDQLFYPENLPAPTFGTPGLIWASLTLALLTVPVVIVSTEEGLSRVPSAIREGAFALGATKAETIWKTILPISSPAIMTGLILAIARAAGEVAPLMLVGVVKLAPSLPLDGNFPYLHLDRKFMHLGFHIYDVGFQSPNVEAARPLVYATALLLVLIIIVLNLTAIYIRNNLREKYKVHDN